MLKRSLRGSDGSTVSYSSNFIEDLKILTQKFLPVGAMNPFIYAFYSVDFRAAFWRLTLRKFFKNSRKPPYVTNNMSIRR